MLPELPSEIWSHIFSLACTDGGTTGRSLSSVSREFRRQSARFKNQSLSLTSYKQIIHLSSLLPALNDHEKWVLYLSIRSTHPCLYSSDEEDDSDFTMGSQPSSSGSSGQSDFDSQVTDQQNEMETGGDLEISEQYIGREEKVGLLAEATAFLEHIDGSEYNNDDEDSSMDAYDHELAVADDQIVSAIFSLLQTVSCSLQVLSIALTSFHPRLMEEFLPKMPTLRELYVFRAFAAIDTTEPSTDAELPHLFPALQCLRIGGHVEQRAGSFAVSLATLAPNLKRLRIPYYFFLDDERTRHFPLIRVPLEALILEYPSFVLSQPAGSHLLVDDATLAKLFGGAQTSGSQASLLVQSTDNDHHEWEALWLDRITGGEGCWISV